MPTILFLPLGFGLHQALSLNSYHIYDLHKFVMLMNCVYSTASKYYHNLQKQNGWASTGVITEMLKHYYDVDHGDIGKYKKQMNKLANKKS